MRLKIKKLLFQFFYFFIKKLNLSFGNSTYAIVFSPNMQNYNAYFREYFQDIARYIEYSAKDDLFTDEHRLIHRIIAHYHVIEKGLSMPEPRVGFGENIVSSLVELISVYKGHKFHENNQQFLAAVQVLKQYVDFNRNNCNVNVELYRRIDTIVNSIDLSGVEDSVLIISKNEYIKNSSSDFKILATSRVSVRDFSNEPVSLDLVKDAIRVAIKTPSVCNRQSWSTIVVVDKQKISEILAIHNGNRGFGHLIQCLIIVKADIRCFLQSEERNQVFIDSGMFGMSLVYALQYEQLGTVVLNWATNGTRDKELRKLLPIQDSEVVSMIIATGNLKESFSVPRSIRKSVDSLMQIV